MDKNEPKNIKRHLMMTIMDVVLLIAHVFLLLFFTVTQIYLMVYVNIGSVLWYGLLIVLLMKKKLHTSAATWLTTAEIMIHLVFALLCLGWSCGFQLYCIALLSILFFSSYGTNNNESYIFHPLLASIISMTIFFGMEVYTSYAEPLYTISYTMQKILYNGNALLIFFLVITFSKVYSDLIRTSEITFRREANIDELTKLYNRRKMREVLGSVHEKSAKDKLHYCVAMFDIDDFKNVNDTYSHEAGDYVLVTIAGILIAHCSDSVHVCRWGGEEFLFIKTYQTEDCTCCIDEIEDIRNAIGRHQFSYNGSFFHVTVTAGVARHAEGMPISTIIEKADENLYSGKSSGKNKTVFAD